MCGIVGYVGGRPAREILLRGLEKLEYRGYDSAGLSLVRDGADRLRARGGQPVRPARGRRRAVARDGGAWPPRPPSPRRASATRAGPPTAASPRRTPTRTPTPTDRVHIVLNGIVENYVELRARLQAEGAEFTSRDRRRGGGPPDLPPLRRRPRDRRPPGLRRAARPLRLRRHVGRRPRAASSAPARSARSWWAWARASTSWPRPIPAFLRTPGRPAGRGRRDRGRPPRRRRVLRRRGVPSSASPTDVDWDEEAAEKGGYETFMLKEIHEQPDALRETIADRLVGRRRSTSATSA